MEQLRLDFNRRDPRDRVRIDPTAHARNETVLATIRAGDRVLVVDTEGNRCEGVLVLAEAAPEGHRLRVALDRSTWVDGEEEAAVPLPHFASAP